MRILRRIDTLNNNYESIAYVIELSAYNSLTYEVKYSSPLKETVIRHQREREIIENHLSLVFGWGWMDQFLEAQKGKYVIETVVDHESEVYIP